jgi:hypothetical protein
MMIQFFFENTMGIWVNRADVSIDRCAFSISVEHPIAVLIFTWIRQLLPSARGSRRWQTQQKTRDVNWQ